MNFDFDETQQEIRQTAREMLAARSPLAKVRAAAESGSYDDALVEEISELGWPGIAVAEKHGGLGLGLVELCVLLEQGGYALAGAPLLSSSVSASVIQALGDDEQRARWLPGLASGELRGAVGYLEGSSALAVDATDADVVVLLGAQQAALLSPADAMPAPIDTIDPTRRYARVEPADAGEPLGSDPGLGLDIAAIATAAELVGVARRALELTVTYVGDRRQFGVPVGSFQAVAHRCAAMLRQVEAATSVVYAAAWAVDAASDDVPSAASLAKVVASESAREVTASAIQAHGGIGFTWEADVHWFYKRAQLGAQLFGGPATHRGRLLQAINQKAMVP